MVRTAMLALAAIAALVALGPLNGSLKGDVSFWLELLNALTLTVLSYKVTQHSDLHYLLADVQTGKAYEVSVQDSDETWVEGLLVFALPFAQRGHHATVEGMADHLYDQLSRPQAFNALD